ncbi:MAG: hypothetical protein ACI9YU_001588, partial [Flavobacteriales bacterium]
MFETHLWFHNSKKPFNMKKILPFIMALFAFGEMQAQVLQDFEITWASDSTWGALCTAPQEIEF